jgi:hypothetical protein
MRAAAVADAEIQARAVAQGRTPDGGRQRQNKPSTVKRKKHNKPLVAHRGRLARARSYQVAEAGPGAFVVLAPAVVAHLKALGYELFEPSRDVLVSDEAEITRAMSRLSGSYQK